MTESRAPGRFSRPVLLFLLILTAPTAARAQIIPIRTVPLGGSDQFFMFPSVAAGMGGATIARTDALADPFRNPATGRRLSRSLLFVSATGYDASASISKGETLPLGAHLRLGDWYVGGAVTTQRLVPEWRMQPFYWSYRADTPASMPSGSPGSPVNTYVELRAAHPLGDGPWSLGLGISSADVHHEGGSEFLYSRLLWTRTDGHAQDLRVGLSGTLAGGRELELMVLHGVQKVDTEVTRESIAFNFLPVPPPVTEHHVLQSELNGLQAIYREPLASVGWTHGWSLTANWKSHPHIPTYQLPFGTSIPRDPGVSQAFQLGSGWAYEGERESFALDLVFEPIFSSTWGTADQTYSDESGGAVPVGATTVRNDFYFANWLMSAGYGRDMGPFAWSVGLHVRFQRYTINQSFLSGLAEGPLPLWLRIRGDQDWIEWTPTWGLTIPGSGYELRYSGRLQRGTGRPLQAAFLVSARGGFITSDLTIASSDVFPATTERIWDEEIPVLTHQIAVIIPIGK